MFTPNVFAADDPITVVNNLSDFIFQLTKVVGGIIAGYGVVQIGLSLQITIHHKELMEHCFV